MSPVEISHPEGCVIGTGCEGWPTRCPEPMRCAVDHLFVLLDLPMSAAVTVTQHPYVVAASGRRPNDGE